MQTQIIPLLPIDTEVARWKTDDVPKKSQMPAIFCRVPDELKTAFDRAAMGTKHQTVVEALIVHWTKATHQHRGEILRERLTWLDEEGGAAGTTADAPKPPDAGTPGKAKDAADLVKRAEEAHQRRTQAARDRAAKRQQKRA
jgi:hypothetical protein